MISSARSCSSSAGKSRSCERARERGKAARASLRAAEGLALVRPLAGQVNQTSNAWHETKTHKHTRGQRELRRRREQIVSFRFVSSRLVHSALTAPRRPSKSNNIIAQAQHSSGPLLERRRRRSCNSATCPRSVERAGRASRSLAGASAALVPQFRWACLFFLRSLARLSKLVCRLIRWPSVVGGSASAGAGRPLARPLGRRARVRESFGARTAQKARPKERQTAASSWRARSGPVERAIYHAQLGPLTLPQNFPFSLAGRASTTASSRPARARPLVSEAGICARAGTKVSTFE